jgi:heme-degrading monooxygenase HmoA
MIIREWRGRTERQRADAYPRHFRDRVLPELRQTAGFLGAELSRREAAGVVEFLVLTRWQSWEAIRGFAGADVAAAVVEPGAVAALTDYDPHVRHYEVLVDESCR